MRDIKIVVVFNLVVIFSKISCVFKSVAPRAEVAADYLFFNYVINVVIFIARNVTFVTWVE